MYMLLLSSLEIFHFFPPFKSNCIYVNISVPVSTDNSGIWEIEGFTAQREGCTFGKSRASSQIIQILI